MTVHSRRALRVTATLAGVAALGATFSGTAFAADRDGGDHGRGDQDNSVRNDSDEFSNGYLDDSSNERTRSADLGVGPTSQLDLLDFALPTSGPSSLAPAKKKKDDDESFDSNPNSTGPSHYYPGAKQPPYDFDLYSPLEKYGSNGCKDAGADRAPFYATIGGFGGYNGKADRDCKVGSKDYEPEDTGYKGGKDKTNGYSGYVGTDPSR
jgi:hypothetical protein